MNEGFEEFGYKAYIIPLDDELVDFLPDESVYAMKIEYFKDRLFRYGALHFEELPNGAPIELINGVCQSKKEKCLEDCSYANTIIVKKRFKTIKDKTVCPATYKRGVRIFKVIGPNDLIERIVRYDYDSPVSALLGWNFVDQKVLFSLPKHYIPRRRPRDVEWLLSHKPKRAIELPRYKKIRL